MLARRRCSVLSQRLIGEGGEGLHPEERRVRPDFPPPTIWGCWVWQELQGIAGRLIDVILPRHCYRCGQPIASAVEGSFCAACWGLIRLITPPYCPCCGEPFRSPMALTYSPEYRCGACRATPPAFDRARAIGHYEGPLRQAIHLLKYQGKLHVQQPLLQLAIAHFDVHFPATTFDAIIPVPLHYERLIEREFNQATVLARGLARSLNVPVLERLLVRVRSTRPQVGLTGHERRQNVRHAFRLTDPPALADKIVLIVDDVLTTGATLGEVAKTLKAAGARQVDVFAIARVVRH
jgi:ComF family protein